MSRPPPGIQHIKPITTRNDVHPSTRLAKRNRRQRRIRRTIHPGHRPRRVIGQERRPADPAPPPPDHQPSSPPKPRPRPAPTHHRSTSPNPPPATPTTHHPPTDPPPTTHSPPRPPPQPPPEHPPPPQPRPPTPPDDPANPPTTTAPWTSRHPTGRPERLTGTGRFGTFAGVDLASRLAPGSSGRRSSRARILASVDRRAVSAAAMESCSSQARLAATEAWAQSVRRPPR